MDKRTLGTTGMEVSALCFGGNVFGWTADEATSFALLDAFVDAGGNFIDTADSYSRWVPGHEGGESEAIIGKWLRARGNRDKVIIATKVGSDLGPGGKGLSREHIMRSVEASLRRLQTDYIDLYQSHRDDEETPQEETMAAYAELIAQGKVRAIGASNFTPARLKSALAVADAAGQPRYATLQPLYNLYDRAVYEAELEPLCQAEGVAVIPYYALAAGFLTGKYRSEADLAGRARARTVPRYMNERGWRVLAAIDNIVAERGISHAHVALAWLLARPSVTAPIVSATSLEQLAQLTAAAAVRLTAEELRLLDKASWEDGTSFA